jgi:prepilin-type N-terminal cleavage/methylation domain-containing protein
MRAVAGAVRPASGEYPESSPELELAALQELPAAAWKHPGGYTKAERRKKMLGNAVQARRGQCGFTLIELIMVIVILAILLALALPAYLGTRERAYKPEAQTNLQEMRMQAWLFFVERGTFENFVATGPTVPDTANWSFAYDPGTAAEIVMTATGKAGRLVAGNTVTLTLRSDGSAVITAAGF